MSAIIYSLCALTALGCAVLLLRGYKRSRYRLLLWSGLCFLLLAANNVLLLLDKIVVTGTDLALVRALTALAGLGFLLYGLIWEAR